MRRGKKLLKKCIATTLTLAMMSACVAVPPVGAKAMEDDEIETTGEITEEVTEEISEEKLEEVTEEILEADNADEFNYAKLLQYSLYFYDANMCGADVSETSLLNWRGNCHTFDETTYTRSDGTTVSVNLNGGFHDAGDHVKFGLPEAYAAFVLGMSYDTNKEAYKAAKQTGHLKNLTTHFAEYFVNCTVLNSSGSSVEAFCCQVGQGGGGYDHGYWGAPENQTNSNRPIYFTSASDPSTDIVCLSAAALAMQYKNFGGERYLTTAKMLFDYAKSNSKNTNQCGQEFYPSSAWEDDYCLAALMLYKVTGDSAYLNEFNQYKDNSNAQKPYWPLGWDNVGPAVAYYNNNISALSTIMSIGGGTTFSDGFRCLSSWGSARYNTSMQYTGLMYDKLTGSSTYKSWATTQMNYLLGNNNASRCYIVGYNSLSSKYPHHRATSGYEGGPKGTTTQAHVLLGALVGGPKEDGSYTDSADDYQCNEVAIDYNATLVAASAALYQLYQSDSSQVVDSAYYIDKEDEVEDDIKVERIDLNKTSLAFVIGENDTLTATVYPSNATNKNVSWASDNTGVATVDSNGKVTALAAGTATITATAADGSGISASCKVTVTNPVIKVTKIKLDKSELSLVVGEYSNVSAEVTPENATNRNITWSSNNTGVATVDSNGKVTAVSAGTATITATAADGSGISASCKVTVTNPVIKVTKIKLDKSELSLVVGEYSNVSAEVTPENATNRNITWSSNNTGVATVDSNGKVTAVSAGTATITATAADGSGISASCQVTVTNPVTDEEIKVTDITLSTTAATLLVGKTISVKATVLPENATNKELGIASLDSSVATVTEDGVVTAISTGTTYIVFTAKDGSGVSKKCFIKVCNDISTAKVKFTATDFAYNEAGNTPAPIVTFDGTVLKKNTDYTVKYENNVNPGTATVTVTGIGKYRGTAKGYFRVNPSITKFTSVLNGSSYIYLEWNKSMGANGYYIYRSDNGGAYNKIKTITSGSTLVYYDRDNLSNGVRYKYKIVACYSPSNVSAPSAYKDIYRVNKVVLTGVSNSAIKTITVKWDRVYATTGYQVRYATKSDFSDKTYVYVAGGSKLTTNINNLVKGKTYYVSVRAVRKENDVYYFGAWSSPMTVTVKK